MRNVLLVVLSSLVAVTPVAAEASAVGRITAASPGSFIMRDGAMVPAERGAELFAGNLIVTRIGGTVAYSYGKCMGGVGEASIISISSSDCVENNAVSLLDEDEDEADAKYGLEGIVGDGSGNTVIALLALIAVSLGLYALFDDERQPVSS